MLLHRAMPMSVDALLEVVRQRGLRLNNLFQLEDGRWQANVTDGLKYWEFGRGDSAEEALRAALLSAATTEPQYAIPEPKPAPVAYDSPRQITARPIIRLPRDPSKPYTKI